MTRSRILILLVMLIIGCNTSNEENKSTQNKKDSIAISQPNSILDTSNDYRKEALWIYQYDSLKDNYKPYKTRFVLSDTLDIQKIQDLLNRAWPEIKLKYVKTLHDTIFVSIPESTVLTQQMGTTGAEEYMVSVTYTFTELKSIHHVSFDFEEGDHAVPGVYDRSLWDLKLQ